MFDTRPSPPPPPPPSPSCLSPFATVTSHTDVKRKLTNSHCNHTRSIRRCVLSRSFFTPLFSLAESVAFWLYCDSEIPRVNCTRMWTMHQVLVVFAAKQKFHEGLQPLGVLAPRFPPTPPPLPTTIVTFMSSSSSSRSLPLPPSHLLPHQIVFVNSHRRISDFINTNDQYI